VSETLSRVEEAAEGLQRLVLRPLGPLGGIVSFLRGLRRGIEVYRQLGAADRDRRGRARYEGDEHLFI
jgi:hypothetical protein